MTAQAITAARLAEARDRVARRKRVQPKLAAELIAEVERLRGDLEWHASKRAFSAKLADEYARGWKAGRGQAAELRALAQRVVDAQYPDGTEQPGVAVVVSQLSGWLNDNAETT